MNVINPRYRSKPAQKSKKRSVKPLGVMLLVTVLVAGGLYLTKQMDTKPDSNNQNNSVVTSNNNLVTKGTGTTFKQFTGEQFRDLYNNFSYANTAPIAGNTLITGNEAADTRIRAVAEQRGYRQRSAPVSDAFQEALPSFKLQQPAVQPWKDMQAEAKNDNINLGLTAAYRSADDQRKLFMARLNNLGITPEAIATGNYDQQISQILRMTAIPGYSRHHTGYTIDIACDDAPDNSFLYTECFEWLSVNNYEKAKKYGWIPSYPEGAGNQGPDPESWEYVWVGTAALTQ